MFPNIWNYAFRNNPAGKKFKSKSRYLFVNYTGLLRVSIFSISLIVILVSLYTIVLQLYKKVRKNQRKKYTLIDICLAKKERKKQRKKESHAHVTSFPYLLIKTSLRNIQDSIKREKLCLKM